MASTVAEQVAVEKLSPGEYISKHKPIRMGNTARIAYGGCTIAIAVSAACDTVENSAGFSLYSALGNFLGPASIDLHLYCTVTTTRQTRSFATRRVQVKQKVPSKKKGEGEEEFRICLDLLADFHIPELPVKGNPFNNYSSPPHTPWPQPEDCPDLKSHVSGLLARGVITKSQAEEFDKTLGAGPGFFETRYCLNGVSGQTLGGIASSAKTTQDPLSITDKTSAEWQRAIGFSTDNNNNNTEEKENPKIQMGILAFLMDGALSFLPLTHYSPKSALEEKETGGKMWFQGNEELELQACSSLDFALRVFTKDIRMERWMLKERMTGRGGGGRTYSESRLWDGETGELVAGMTQQSIMRVVRRDRAGGRGKL